LIHFDEKDHAKTKKWRPFSEDNEPHYCDANKISSLDVSFITVPQPSKNLYPQPDMPPLPRQERGEITLSAREWANLREQIVAIHIQLSEMTQTLKALVESRQQEQQQAEERNQVSGVKYESDSIEDQINAIDFDKMFSESNPS
jgi:hypothetical protein